jgi:methanogenic corrinoid protein MtbC1
MLTDQQILDAIQTVCGFDWSEAQRWRAEALMIGRAVAQASRRAAIEQAAQVAHGYSLQAERIICAIADGDTHD